MQVQKTVFISYRRTNVYHARAVYYELTHRGYDVFLDYENIDSGAFDRIILGQIDARAHFLIVLTPSALERCADPNDWLRREIERAIDMQRNIVPLMFSGFNFRDMQQYLVGKLAALSQYNGLNVPDDYFDEAIERLDRRFLSKPLDTILHPTPPKDRVEVEQRQVAAQAAPKPTEEQLTAEQHNERGIKRSQKEDYAGAIADYNEAIRLNPQYAHAYTNRGLACKNQGDYAGAIADFSEAIHLNPQDAIAYINRGEVNFALKKFDQALNDFKKANELTPGYNFALGGLGITYHAMGNLKEAQRLWCVLLGMDKRYRDVEWVKKELNWAEPLVEEARKLIAGL